MIKFNKSHVFIIAFFSFAFIAVILVQNHIINKRFKNVKLIEKQQEINITVKRDYINRGEIIFNDKYCIIGGRLQNRDGINGVFHIKVPYKLVKKANNDTIWLSNNDTTIILVLK